MTQFPFKVVKYGSKKNPSRKSKISQDQVDWLMMELQTMRETNEKIRNGQRGQEEPAGNS